MVEKEKFYCQKASEQAPKTRGEITEDFCLRLCKSVQRGVKAECPDSVKGTPRPPPQQIDNKPQSS